MEALEAVLDLRTDVEAELEGPGPISTEPGVRIEHHSLYPDIDRKIDAAGTVKPWGTPVERPDDGRSRLPANQRNHRVHATLRNRRLRDRRTHTTGRRALAKRRRPPAGEPLCSPEAGFLSASIPDLRYIGIPRNLHVSRRGSGHRPPVRPSYLFATPVSPSARAGRRGVSERFRGRAITTLCAAASSLCRPCNRPLPRWREIKAAVRSGAHRGSLLGDRTSARFGGRRGSSPPWDQRRRPARTTASIRALARRLQARDARLWRDPGARSPSARHLF
jgi:hypothetical protein